MASQMISSVVKGMMGMYGNNVNTPDGLDAGYAIACASGTAITRALARDPGGRVTARNGEAYAYNSRNELASAVYPNAAYAYAYDEIGDQKSAKPKPGRGATAILRPLRRSGARSGIPRRSGHQKSAKPKPQGAGRPRF